jgi:AGCS family alanine or glycine:cation symporter
MALIFFAFTSILGWNYYGERCLEYLTNGNRTGIKIYRWLYILNVLIGPFLTVSAVWNIADIFNGLMAIPNMICLFTLSGTIARETNAFFRERAYRKQNEDDRQALEELRVEDGAIENAEADRSYARSRKKHK